MSSKYLQNVLLPNKAINLRVHDLTIDGSLNDSGGGDVIPDPLVIDNLQVDVHADIVDISLSGAMDIDGVPVKATNFWSTDVDVKDNLNNPLGSGTVRYSYFDGEFPGVAQRVTVCSSRMDLTGVPNPTSIVGLHFVDAPPVLPNDTAYFPAFFDAGIAIIQANSTVSPTPGQPIFLNLTAPLTLGIHTLQSFSATFDAAQP